MSYCGISPFQTNLKIRNLAASCQEPRVNLAILSILLLKYPQMAKYELKTKANDSSVEDFINSLENKVRREDGLRVLEMFERLTGEKGKMWGPAIIGVGNRIYRYPDGREMDWMVIAFSPRKQNLTLYVICDSPKQSDLLEKLGKHKTSVSCLYINELADVDLDVLEKIIADAYQYSQRSNSIC